MLPDGEMASDVYMAAIGFHDSFMMQIEMTKQLEKQRQEAQQGQPQQPPQPHQ